MQKTRQEWLGEMCHQLENTLQLLARVSVLSTISGEIGKVASELVKDC